MLQGLPKKIEIDLLLADFAFQFGNASLGRLDRRLRCGRRNRSRRHLARATRTTQRTWATRFEAITPNVKVLAQDLQLSCKRAHVLPSQESRNRCKLEFSTFDTEFLFGHVFPFRELSLIFRVSLSGGTQSLLAWIC